MRAYIIRRLLIAIPTLFIVSMIVFGLVRILPGDIVEVMQQEAEFAIDRAMVERKFGLDKPLIVQYARWMGLAPQADGNFSGVLQGDFGVSWWTWTPVTGLLALKWPVTAQLGLMGLIVSQIIALPIGIYSAIRQDTWGDYTGRSFAILCISLPSFWVGTLIVVFGSIWWGYMPPLRFIWFTEDPIANLQMMVVPSLIMGMALAGTTMRMTRNMLLEVLRQDYIRTAWAKGLRERVVIIRHALKNSFIPVITQIGLQVSVMLGGTVVIENIFCLPGVGRLLIHAANSRDYPLMTGIMLFFAVTMVLVNLIIDLTYAYLDPRIHYK